MDDLKCKVRTVPDWPKKGVNFKDITTLIQDGDCFREVIDLLANPLKGRNVDKIVGIDARGFLVAAPVAYKLGVGLAIVRKPSKLPYKKISEKYLLEYGSDTLEMHIDSIKPGEKIVLIDDLIATGGSAGAACNLIERSGGKILETLFVMDLVYLGGSKKLKDRGYTVKSLMVYDDE